MQVEKREEDIKAFKSITNMMYESSAFIEFFETLKKCGIDLPTNLEILQEELFPMYEMVRDHDGKALDSFLTMCLSFYTLKAPEYVEDSDSNFEEYQKMSAFIRLELDRLWVYEKIFSATSTKPAKYAKQSVAVRLLLLQAISEKPEWVQMLSEEAKKILYHIILNCDKRAVIGFENSKAFGSKESTYILTPEHHQEVQDIIDMLKQQ